MVLDTPFKNVAMQWLPVRCCCTPQKVFGFIQVRADVVHDGATLNLLPRAVAYQLAHADAPEVEELLAQSAVRFQVKMLTEVDYPNSKRELAVYSEDHPIEFWRTIDGFVEAQRQ